LITRKDLRQNAFEVIEKEQILNLCLADVLDGMSLQTWPGLRVVKDPAKSLEKKRKSTYNSCYTRNSPLLHRPFRIQIFKSSVPYVIALLFPYPSFPGLE